MMAPMSSILSEGLDSIEQLSPNGPNTQEILASACIYHSFWQVRLKAIEKITKPSLLTRVAQHSQDYEVFREAVNRIDDEKALEEIAQFPCEDKYACIMALRRLDDQEALARIAQTHPYSAVRLEAVALLVDGQALLGIATENSDIEVREAATLCLTDPKALASIACSDPSRSVRKAAVAALTDLDVLATLATKARPMLIRRDALRRMRDICGSEHLAPELAARLLPCLEESTLAAYAADLMEKAGFAWWEHCSEPAVEAFAAAAFACHLQQEAAILENALARLYRSRVDLRGLLLSRIPQCFAAEARGKSAVWDMAAPQQLENHMLVG